MSLGGMPTLHNYRQQLAKVCSVCQPPGWTPEGAGATLMSSIVLGATRHAAETGHVSPGKSPRDSAQARHLVRVRIQVRVKVRVYQVRVRVRV